MPQTNIVNRPRPTLEQKRRILFREMLSEYSFSLQESAFVMVHTQGSVCVFVSMLNRLYGWKLQRYTGEAGPGGPLPELTEAEQVALQCPVFYYRDRVTHRLYLLISNPACAINDTQKARQYDTVLIVQGEGAFEEQQHIFADLSVKCSREVPYGDNRALLRETLRHLICSKLVHSADYFDFSRSEESRSKQDDPGLDYLDRICLTNTSSKGNRKTSCYAKPARKEDYQREKQMQQTVVPAPQIGLFDDAEKVSERQASASSANREIRSSLMDDVPAHVVDMVRYRQLLALQDMGKAILKSLWLKMCNG